MSESDMDDAFLAPRQQRRVNIDELEKKLAGLPNNYVAPPTPAPYVAPRVPLKTRIIDRWNRAVYWTAVWLTIGDPDYWY